MEALELIRTHAGDLPLLARFAIAMALIVGIPPLARRARLPVVVGLLLSGIVVGPYGLGIFPVHPSIADFFAELGKLMLMFFAGLEINSALFPAGAEPVDPVRFLHDPDPASAGQRPLDSGSVAPAAAFPGGRPGVAARVAYPPGSFHRRSAGCDSARTHHHYLRRDGDLDTLSLVVFAVCVSTYQSGFSVSGITVQLVEIAVFVPLILLGLSRVGAIS